MLIRHDPHNHFSTAKTAFSMISVIETTFSCPSCRNHSNKGSGHGWTHNEFSPLESGKGTSSSGKMAGTSNMLNSGMAGNSSCSSNFKATVVKGHDMIKVESYDVACYGMQWQVWLIKSKFY